MNIKKMKIGIITYHEPISYGAHLQCLGLQMYLKEIGCNPEIINYSKKAYLELLNTKRTKTLINRILNVLKDPITFLKAKNNAKKIEKEKKKFKELLNDRNRKFEEIDKMY